MTPVVSIDDVGRAEWKHPDDPSLMLRRALRLRGDIDVDRLTAALKATLSTHLSNGVGVAVETETSPLDDAASIALLRATKPSDGIHGAVIAGVGGDVVLGVVGHQRFVDLPSIYRLLTDAVVAYLAVVPAESDAVAKPRPPSEETLARRMAWWDDHLQTALVRPAPSPPSVAPPATHRVMVERPVWLGQDSEALTGQLPELALLAAISEAAADREFGPIPWLFPLDLRQVLPSDRFVGPFSDRIVLALGGGSGLGSGPGEQLRQAHGGLLTAVMRYVPHDWILTSLANPPGRDRAVWEFLYCPHPAESANTRADPGLGRHGISIELFAEPDLAEVGLPAARRPLDVVARFTLGEGDAATGAKLVQVEYREDCRFGALAPWALDAAIGRLEAA